MSVCDLGGNLKIFLFFTKRENISDINNKTRNSHPLPLTKGVSSMPITRICFCCWSKWWNLSSRDIIETRASLRAGLSQRILPNTTNDACATSPNGFRVKSQAVKKSLHVFHYSPGQASDTQAKPQVPYFTGTEAN